MPCFLPDVPQGLRGSDAATGSGFSARAGRLSLRGPPTPLQSGRHGEICVRPHDTANGAVARSHSVTNRLRKPAWLKGLAVIDMGYHRRFDRRKRRSFAGARDRAICAASTLSALSSTRLHPDLLGPALEHPVLLRPANHATGWPAPRRNLASSRDQGSSPAVAACLHGVYRHLDAIRACGLSRRDNHSRRRRAYCMVFS